jgi:hypothetical protein
MTGQERVTVWITGLLSVCMAAAALLFFIIRQRPPGQPLTLTGVTLRRDTDPRKQRPIGGVEIIATNGAATVKTLSDAFGLFTITIPGEPKAPKPPDLTFQAQDYLPSVIKSAKADQLYLVYLTPQRPGVAEPVSHKQSVLANIRVRYSEKAEITTNTGSLVKSFEVVNKGNVPCNQHPPCSPDGKWKATVASFVEVAQGPGQEFRRARLSCIAGPCPFTRIEPQTNLADGPELKIEILNWSDTTTFLLEAEVSQRIVSDMIRESFPAVFGSSMNFTLPARAQGPSIQAELNGQDIVFPLGPNLTVSWGICSVKVAPDKTKAYRCDLKPGYRFHQ